MNTIIQISVILYSISLGWMIQQRLQSYPVLSRFEDFQTFIKWKITKKLTIPNKIKKNDYENYIKNSFFILLVAWFIIFIWLAGTSISLYFLDILIGDAFSFITLIFVPFIYLLIPQFISRLLTSVVFLTSQDDYFWYKKRQRSVIDNAYFKGYQDIIERNLQQKNIKYFVNRAIINNTSIFLCVMIPLILIQI